MTSPLACSGRDVHGTRISQTERLDVEERQIGQSHRHMRSLPRPEFVVTGDAHGGESRMR